MHRISIVAVLLLAGAIACSGSASKTSAVPTPHHTRTRTPSRSHAPPVSPTPPPSIVPTGISAGTPKSYPKDVGAIKIKPQDLVRPGVTVTDAWSTTTLAGETAGVAYVLAGDPLAAPHGLVIWRRTPGATPPWVPVFGLSTAVGAGVVQMETQLGEATGDGSDDALIFEGTGGSGACGTSLVIDLAANAQVFKKTACDTVVGFSPKPVGLQIQQAVYAPSDSHCCPSAFQTTILTYSGNRFVIASRTTSPT
ncbi:MAG: hypothetical protein QOE25_148 [Actinomycetota bacterium]|nr:hypothetical protein [Actinomycetota bacterium]